MARARITDRDLEQVARIINTTMGYALEPHGKDADGKYKPNPNVYHIDHAYGAVALHQMMPEGSGIREIISRGTKRELYSQMRAFADGLDAAKRVAS